MTTEEAVAGTELPTYSVIVQEAPKFDLRSYIAGYKDRTVFRRLHLIASCSTALREEAAKLAIIEAKKGKDVNNYRAAVELLRSTTTADAEAGDLIDPGWIVEQEKKNAAESKRMENELKQYKNNLIRESIRMGNEDLGLHYHRTGELGNAVKAFSRMRDFCTTPVHIASTAFLIIAVAIEQRNWLAVQSQVHKIRNSQMTTEQAAKSQPRAAAAMGLQQMSLGDYREAATSFLSTDPALQDTYNEVLTSNDVAVYGGLCALASMNRAELQTKVLENSNFRNFLELEPHIRRAITYFCASKYGQCLDILESYRADYLLDIYLQSQLENIYHAIRTKSIVQYFQPFSKVTLKQMETMFASPAITAATSNDESHTSQGLSPISRAFLDELVSLIQAHLLPARIDLETQSLVVKVSDPRADAQSQALETVDGFIREARVKLLRMAAMNAGIEVRRELKDKNDVAGNAMDLAGLLEHTTGSGGGGTSAGRGAFSGQGYSLRGAQ